MLTNAEKGDFRAGGGPQQRAIGKLKPVDQNDGVQVTGCAIAFSVSERKSRSNCDNSGSLSARLMPVPSGLTTSWALPPTECRDRSARGARQGWMPIGHAKAVGRFLRAVGLLDLE